MKLIDKLLERAVNNSTVVLDTAINAYDSALQLIRLARSVASLARVVGKHAQELAQLREFNRQLVQGTLTPVADHDDITLLNEIQSDEDKKRMN